MIAAALLLALASGGEVSARLFAEPARAAIGEPVDLVLEVEHEADVQVKLPGKDPVADATDRSWVLLEGRRVERTAGRTRAVWRICSLEPGERALPPVAVEAGSTRVEAQAGVLSVAAALGEGEDAPRPMKGFRPPSEDARWGAAGLARWPWILAALALAGAGLAWWRRRRALLRLEAAPPPGPIDRLSELEKLAQEDPAAARGVVYALSALLRESIDALVREPRAALTDAAWIARVEDDERVPLGARRATARLLADAERVKYAMAVPTRFALSQTLATARGVLEALAAAPKPAAAAKPLGEAA